MSIKTPSSVLRIPYLAVRTPLGLLDEHLVVRVFGTGSTAHRSLLRGLHTLDALAASVFPPAPAEHAAADEPDEPATADEPAGRDGGEQPIGATERSEIEQLTETLLADDDLAPRTGELAENDELRRVQAEIRAKQEVETEHGQL